MFRGNVWQIGRTALLRHRGVRLVLQLPEGRALSGQLRRDWMRPTLTP